MNNANLKIAIITRSLAGGGVERFNALLSKMLTGLGFEVHLITVLDEIEYDYEGILFNLGQFKKQNDTIFGRFSRFLKLNSYLKKHHFDWVIDSRNRHASWSEWIISKYIYNPKKTMYMVHSYKTDYYFPKSDFLARIIYKKSPYIVTVSKEIQTLIEEQYGYQNVTTIYNSVDIEKLNNSVTVLDTDEKFILSYGRIDDGIKNYSLLIESYAASILPDQNILLYIIGDGKDVAALKQKVATLQLSDKIIFKPKLLNPFSYVKTALFTTLTSRNEGFPLVIIESLALGTPVISVDCHSGPREMIQNEHNGLLVENHNVDALTKAMNRLIENPVLYAFLKTNAAKSVAHLSLSAIAQQWKQLLKSKKNL